MPVKIRFSELKIGDKFECYGDTFINYNYPKICQCIKTGNSSAEEINGVSFSVSEYDEVLIIKK